jgi:hypothetical protein
MTEASSNKWVDDVIAALRSLGGMAHLSQIYREILLVRPEAKHIDAVDETVRQTLQAHCNECRQYRGGPSFFQMRPDRGDGYWAINMLAIEKRESERAEAAQFLKDLGLE